MNEDDRHSNGFSTGTGTTCQHSLSDQLLQSLLYKLNSPQIEIQQAKEGWGKWFNYDGQLCSMKWRSWQTLKWSLSLGTGNNMLALVIWQNQCNCSHMNWTHLKNKSTSLKEGQEKGFNLTVRFVKWRWQALKWTLSLVTGNNLPALIIRQTWSNFDHCFVDHSVYIVHLVHPLKRHAVLPCTYFQDYS